MGALTSDERRRVFLARQQANRAQLARPSAPGAAPEPYPLRRRLKAILKMAMIVALLATGWFAFHAVEFHMPGSIAEALRPL